MRLPVLVILFGCGVRPPPVVTPVRAETHPACATLAANVLVGGRDPDEVARMRTMLEARCHELEATAGRCTRAARAATEFDACLHGAPDPVAGQLEHPDHPDGELDGDPFSHEHAAPMGTQAQIAAQLHAQGLQLYTDNQYAAAATKFREAVARVPEARYFLDLCRALAKQGRFAEATSACHAGTKLTTDPALLAELDTTLKALLTEAQHQHINVK